MKQILETVARLLVDAPDEVRITEVEGKETLIFELRCNSQDVGRIIGKGGKTVGAIRTLLSAIAAKQGRNAMLEVID